MFKTALLHTSGTWWLDKCETLSLMWQLDPQSEKVEAASPVKTEDWQSYDITSAAFVGEIKSQGQPRLKGRENISTC